MKSRKVTTETDLCFEFWKGCIQGGGHGGEADADKGEKVEARALVANGLKMGKEDG